MTRSLSTHLGTISRSLSARAEQGDTLTVPELERLSRALEDAGLLARAMELTLAGGPVALDVALLERDAAVEAQSCPMPELGPNVVAMIPRGCGPAAGGADVVTITWPTALVWGDDDGGAA